MGRKSLSSKTQSDQIRGREGILNQSLNREGIQRKKKTKTKLTPLKYYSNNVCYLQGV